MGQILARVDLIFNASKSSSLMNVKGLEVDAFSNQCWLSCTFWNVSKSNCILTQDNCADNWPFVPMGLPQIFPQYETFLRETTVFCAKQMFAKDARDGSLWSSNMTKSVEWSILVLREGHHTAEWHRLSIIRPKDMSPEEVLTWRRNVEQELDQATEGRQVLLQH